MWLKQGNDRCLRGVTFHSPVGDMFILPWVSALFILATGYSRTSTLNEHTETHFL